MIITFLLLWLAAVIITYAIIYQPKPITLSELNKVRINQRTLRKEFETYKVVTEEIIKDVIKLKNQKPKTIEVNINGKN